MGIGGCIVRHGAGCGDNFGTGGNFQQPVIVGAGSGCTSGRCGSGNIGFGGGSSGCTSGRCGSGGSGSSGCVNGICSNGSGCINGRCSSGGSGFGNGSSGCVNGRCFSGGSGFGSISDRQETRASDNSAVNF